MEPKETERLAGLTVEQLRAECRARSLPVGGKRETLLTRLGASAEEAASPEPDVVDQADVVKQSDLANIGAASVPKPTGGGAQTQRHNAQFDFVELETSLYPITAKSYNGKHTHIEARLHAAVDPELCGLPKDIERAARGFWQAAGANDGATTTTISPKRIWAQQVYTFAHPTIGAFELAAEVKGDPKLRISAADEWGIEWTIAADVTKADYDRLHDLLRAESFRLTTRNAQTDIED